MNHIFPEPIKNLPKADIPLEGVTAYLSQSDTHQILFIEFDPIVYLHESMGIIPQLDHAIQQGQLEEAADYIRQVAEVETKAYTELSELVA